MLIGNHVALRAIERSDLQTLLNWRNQSEFRQFFREYRELNSDQQDQWFQQVVLNDRNVLMFAIIDKHSGELLGACGLCYINWRNRTADFSIYIGHQGLYLDDKYAPDTAKVLSQYAFEEINLNKLWAEVYDFDQKKIAFFENLGFKQEGCFRENTWSHGQWHDSLFFGLLKSEASSLLKSAS